MPFNQDGDIKYYSFDSLDDTRVVQGIFTRRGGVSPHPWDSLNLGGTVGDVRHNVVENRRRIFEVVHRPVESIYDSWQVHSAKVLCTEASRPLGSPHIKADAILTNNPQVTLFMRFADCAPILLHDPVRNVIGMIHAGWVGTVKQIAEQAVKTMAIRYGSVPADIRAGIGPSIGPDHYEVGEDVNAAVMKVFGDQTDSLLIKRNGKLFFDLWEANRQSLARAGVHKVQVARLCTACTLEDWYSHRAENGQTGRFGALLGLRG